MSTEVATIFKKKKHCFISETRIIKNLNAQCSFKSLYLLFLILLFHFCPAGRSNRGSSVTWGGRLQPVSDCRLELQREGSSCMARVWLTNLSIPVSAFMSISSSSFSPTRVQTDPLLDPLAPSWFAEASRSKNVSSAVSTLYVSGLKEQSEVAVVSTALGPCLLWSTKSWREEREGEEEESQVCLHKTSLNVALRLGGRSREESMLLQAWVCTDTRGSVWAGGKENLSVCAGERGWLGWVATGEVGSRSAVVSGGCVSRVGRERVWCWRSAARSRLEILACRRVTSDSCRRRNPQV